MYPFLLLATGIAAAARRHPWHDLKWRQDNVVTGWLVLLQILHKKRKQRGNLSTAWREVQHESVNMMILAIFFDNARKVIGPDKQG